MLNNPRMAELHAQEAPDRVRELEAWGAVFDRTRDGRILQRPFGGHTHPRLAHVGDRTGLEMIRTLQDRAVAAGHHGLHGVHDHPPADLDRPGAGAPSATGGRRASRSSSRPRRSSSPPAASAGPTRSLELVGVLRRRPGPGLPRRRGAHRHGVRPVPSDRDGLAARRPRPARDRGRPGRGRDPAQQRRRAVHVEVPARGPPPRVRRDRRRGRRLGRGARAPARPPTPAGRPSCRPGTTSRARSTPRSRRAAARRTAACSSTSATCRPSTSGASCPRCTSSSRSWPTSTSRRVRWRSGPRPTT